MHHFGNCAAITSAELLQCHQVLTPQIQPEFQPNLQGIGAVAVDISNGAWDLSIAIGRVGRRFGGRIEGKAFDVLSFQRPSLELIRHGAETGGKDAAGFQESGTGRRSEESVK